jgi:phospholipid/cholesterol/gamma-HCH transport system substrate-binding protein
MVQSSSTFVSTMADQRTQLADLVSAAGETSQTVAARTAQLQATLDQAPSTLATLQGFLDKLRAATVPLGPAANDLSDTAPHLVGTLEELPSLISSARPALQAATRVAPMLTTLAESATPVISHAVPVTASLEQTVRDAIPVTGFLSHSVDNIIAIVDNWSRAIQFRDGLSHIFRAEVAVSPDMLNSLLSRYTSGSKTSPARHRSSQPGARSSSTPAANHPAPTTSSPTTSTPTNPTSGLSSGLSSVLSTVLGGVSNALHHTGATGTSGTAGTTGPAFGRLLGYLLGR